MILPANLNVLMQRAQALAALDLIMSPEWDFRYYSFNTSWSPSERMASMRDGCGDEWWLVANDQGWAALKGLAHESAAWREGGEALSKALRAGIPAACGDFAEEPAFRWEDTSFASYYLPSSGSWIRVNDSTPYASLDAGDGELLRHLTAPAEEYVAFANDYYETDIPLEAVEAVYNHQAITRKLVRTLNPDVELEDIQDELFNEIAYPKF